MKKFTLLLSGFFAVYYVYAQQPITLNFETHSILPGADNNMILCQYAEPGNGGCDVTWDFSSLKANANFTGFVNNDSKAKTTGYFQSANTVLEEFNNRFYLRISKDKTEQIGYASDNNNVIITYDQPFVKMVFPFTMNDHYTGVFTGTMKTGQTEFPINGCYEVTADGYGKLILPGNVIANNVLRVKTTKTYDVQLNDITQHVEINTYRWYGLYNRYPLLVLTSVKTSTGTSTFTEYQAAYNNAVNVALPLTDNHQDTPQFSVFPNPSNDFVTVIYTVSSPGKVIIDLYDNTGRKVKNLLNNKLEAGIYNLVFNTAEDKLSPGFYFIRADFGNIVKKENIIITE
jgi:hypothetical protein